MKYSYLHPFNPQYFFHPDCINHQIFQSFYQPYTFKGEFTWWLLRKFKPYRFIFSKRDINKYIPEIQIMDILGRDTMVAINTGSPGPEQKTTAVGVNGQDSVFLKYSNTELGIRLVENEFHILKYIGGNSFVPALVDHGSGNDFFWIKTEFLDGERISKDQLDDDILILANKISSLKVQCNNHSESTLEASFAHGDFCPWNLMMVDGRLMAFDWEMAGYYPLGYDLFTFVFQTNFLLHPGVRIEKIIKNNQPYFARIFKTKDWKPYLASFAKIKLEKESRKNNHRLIPHYKQLSIYANKA